MVTIKLSREHSSTSRDQYENVDSGYTQDNNDAKSGLKENRTRLRLWIVIECILRENKVYFEAA